jgi:predicted ATPase/DNA-binding CsgD family transcriptional regulator
MARQLPRIENQLLRLPETAGPAAGAIEVESAAWYAWLADEQNPSFTFTNAVGTCTVRRERRRRGQYWYAYRRRAGKLYKRYVGKTDELTLDRLNAAADALGGKGQSPAGVGQNATLARPSTPRPPARSMPTAFPLPSQSTLPVPLTPLIGRAQSVAAVAELLRRPEQRLLTLAGAGGIGKTRLAVQVAAEMQAAFIDGVLFVSLAQIRDPALVLPSIARALGLRETGSAFRPADLHAHIGRQQKLLVLDNFEQVVQAAPQLVELLGQCPRVKLLVTSRSRLSVQGEQEYPVGPLALPDGDALDDPAALAQCASVALFVERARATQPDFVFTSARARSIAAICRRLDGLPLAIELAARRVRALSLDQIAERLSDASGLLISGDRAAEMRHQTVTAAIEWSYHLLAEPQRAVFRRLCVFAGGCTLEAAEAIAAGNGIAAGSVLEHLAQLVDQSLVEAADWNGRMRYRLLEVIRQYGQARLRASDEGETISRRHCEWYRALAEQAEPALSGQDQAAWMERLEAEHDNLRAALQWSLAHDSGEAAASIAASIWPFWLVRGYLTEGRYWLDRILDQLPVRSAARSKTLLAAGIMAGRLGNVERAQHLLTESIDLFRAGGDQKRLAFALFTLGVGAQRQGDYEAARLRLAESLEVSRAAGDQPGIGLALSSLGLVASYQGREAEARALSEESLVLFKAAGDVRGTAAVLTDLGQFSLQAGDFARAAQLGEESLSLRQGLGDKGGSAHTLAVLGLAAFRQHDYVRAADNYEKSLRLRQALGEQDGMATALEGLAAIQAARGAAHSAARLLGAAEALRGGPPRLTPQEREALDHTRAATHARLGERAFAAAHGEGRRFVPDEVDGYGALLAPAEDAWPAGTPLNSAPGYPDDLTAREVQVLRLLARGLSDRAIAAALVISARTVQGHLRAVYGKLDVHSRAAATRYAVERKLA